jgi:hypothetical protein
VDLINGAVAPVDEGSGGTESMLDLEVAYREYSCNLPKLVRLLMVPQPSFILRA